MSALLCRTGATASAQCPPTPAHTMPVKSLFQNNNNNNRQMFVKAGLIEMALAATERFPLDGKVVAEAAQALRTLTLDDDIRVSFGKAHERTKQVGGSGRGQSHIPHTSHIAHHKKGPASLKHRLRTSTTRSGAFCACCPA